MRVRGRGTLIAQGWCGREMFPGARPRALPPPGGLRVAGWACAAESALLLLVLEWCGHGTLADALAEERTFAWPRARKLQAAEQSGRKYNNKSSHGIGAVG